MPTIQTSDAARALGAVRSAKKAASSRANLAKARKKVADALAAFQQQEPARNPRPVSVLISPRKVDDAPGTN